MNHWFCKAVFWGVENGAQVSICKRCGRMWWDPYWEKDGVMFSPKECEPSERNQLTLLLEFQFQNPQDVMDIIRPYLNQKIGVVHD